MWCWARTRISPAVRRARSRKWWLGCGRWPSTSLAYHAGERVYPRKVVTSWSGHARASCFATLSSMGEDRRRASHLHEGSPALPPLLAATVLAARGATAERRSFAPHRLTLTRRPHEIAGTRERIRSGPCGQPSTSSYNESLATPSSSHRQALSLPPEKPQTQSANTALGALITGTQSQATNKISPSR